MWIVLLWIILIASQAVADVYKCPDGKGGSQYQNVPCVEREEEPIVISGTAPQGERPSAVVPTPTPRSSAPFVVPQDHEPPQCLSLNNLETQVLTRNKVYTELSWKVDVNNRCRREFLTWLSFEIHDRDGFLVKENLERAVIPSRGDQTVRGRVLISVEHMATASRRSVRFSSVYAQ